MEPFELINNAEKTPAIIKSVNTTKMFRNCAAKYIWHHFLKFPWKTQLLMQIKKETPYSLILY